MTRSDGAPPLAFEILTDIPQGLALWHAHEATLTGVPLTASHTWVSTWIAHFGDLVPHRFAVARRDGAVVGLALLTDGASQYAGPFRIATRHVGTAGEPEADSIVVEYNAPLVAEADRPAFLNALVAMQMQDRSWDSLHLDGFDASLLASLLATPGWTTRAVIAHVHDLQAARALGKEPIEQLGSSTRAEIRRGLRHFGDPTIEWSSTIEQAEAFFAEQRDLHQARWNAEGKPGVYASQRFTEFHRSLLRKWVPEGKLAFAKVLGDGRTIGVLQLFLEGDRALYYQSGTLPVDGKQSPGLVSNYLVLAECGKRGFAVFDFMGGDTLHKRRLSTGTRHLVWGTWQRPRWKFTVVEAARRLRALFARSKPSSET